MLPCLVVVVVVHVIFSTQRAQSIAIQKNSEGRGGVLLRLRSKTPTVLNWDLPKRWFYDTSNKHR